MLMIPDNAHESLFSPAVLKVGEFHSYLVHAFSLIYEVPAKSKDGLPALSPPKSDLRKEIGGDEIHWWVFKREDDIPDLTARVEHALVAAQTLKETSAALKKKRPDSYTELVLSLTAFANEHVAEIDALLEFVRWLHGRHAAAPQLLFSYRVWGSTRRSDRVPDRALDAADVTNPATVRLLSEVALGLRSRFLSAYDRAFFEAHEALWLRLGPENVPEEGIEPAPEEVAARTSSAAYDECSIYFAFIRDSLKNILLDIEKYKEQQNLLLSDDFWRAFIQGAVKTHKTEGLLWDFKQTIKMWHMGGGDERERAKVAFSEDVAALANARGGALVVGVTDARDVVGVGEGRELETRLKVAADVLAGHVQYDRPLWSFHQVGVNDSQGTKKVCLIIAVDQASDVVGVRDGQGRYTYPIRRETGLTRVSSFDVVKEKAHVKNDNRDFLRDLEQFIRGA
jgi:hypothetical protein